VSHEREFTRLAEALSQWPELITRILRGHNEIGVCRGCTMPGGRNVIEAPCGVRVLALLAQRFQQRQTS
jgi:hypothetical protein